MKADTSETEQRTAFRSAAWRRISSLWAITTLALVGASADVAVSHAFAGHARTCQLFSLPAAGEGKKQQSPKSVHKKNSRATDAKAVEMEFWRSVNNLATIEAYQSYLAQYPDGAFKSLAQAEIARLQDLAATQQAAAEQAREKEQELEKQNAADDAAFQTAKALNTQEGYDAYIAAYPSGRHATDAHGAEQISAATPHPVATTTINLSTGTAAWVYNDPYVANYGLSAAGLARVVTPGDAGWGSASLWWPSWIANGANAYGSSSWIEPDPYKSDNGPAPYSFSLKFFVSAASLSTAVLSGGWTIDDSGTLTLNGQIISSLVQGNWHSLTGFSANQSSGLKTGQNTLTITMTGADELIEGVNLAGTLTEQSSDDYLSQCVSPSTGEVSEDAHAQLVLAKNAVQDKKFDDALDHYEQSSSLSPCLAESYFNAALTAGQLQYYDEAVVNMRRYLILSPNSSDSADARDKMIIWEAKTSSPASGN